MEDRDKKLLKAYAENDMSMKKTGGVRVVKVERADEYQQMTMEVQNGN